MITAISISGDHVYDKQTMNEDNATASMDNKNNHAERLNYKAPSRIAFGSCNDQDMVNNLWGVIESRKPAAFIWGGDAIYADFHGPKDWSKFPPRSTHICAEPDTLKSLYEKQLQVPGYKSLLQQNITIFGTYDDHDYGCNNADRTYPFKLESSMAFTEFIGQPNGSPMRIRAQNGQGVYGVKLFDFNRPDGNYEVPDVEAGIDDDIPIVIKNPFPTYSNKSVAIFVLDVRTSKVPWQDGSAGYLPDYEGDFLGERQWEWFENSIRKSRASVNVIVSGLQFHGNRFLDANIAEAWGKFPRAQQRLFDTILQDSVEAPILVSGDVHMTQLARKDCVRSTDYTSRRPLVEFTTSGMTHSWGTIAKPVDASSSHAVSWYEWYESFVGRNTMHFLHYFCPWTDVMIADATSSFESGGGEGAKDGLQYSLDMNFGELEFDWEDRTVTIRAIGEKGDEKAPLLMASLSMDQLSGRSGLSSDKLSVEDYLVEKESRPSVLDGEWVCVNHRGRDTTTDHVIGHLASAMATVPMSISPLIIVGFLVFLLRRFVLLSNNRNKIRNS